MFGLDESIAALGTGDLFLVVAGVAVLLGLRHATDPDHLTAVSTLIAGDERRSPRDAGRLGFMWGLGTRPRCSCSALPIVLFNSYLPEAVQTAAEVAVGGLIIALALRLLMRWRRGEFGPNRTSPRHAARARRFRPTASAWFTAWAAPPESASCCSRRSPSHVEAIAALLLFACLTAVSMAPASTTFGLSCRAGRCSRLRVRRAGDRRAQPRVRRRGTRLAR